MRKFFFPYEILIEPSIVFYLTEQASSKRSSLEVSIYDDCYSDVR